MKNFLLLVFYFALIACSQSSVDKVIVKNEKDGIYPLPHRFAVPHHYRGEVDWEQLDTARALNIQHFETCSWSRDSFGNSNVSISLDSIGTELLTTMSRVNISWPMAIENCSHAKVRTAYYLRKVSSKF